MYMVSTFHSKRVKAKRAEKLLRLSSSVVIFLMVFSLLPPLNFAQAASSVSGFPDNFGIGDTDVSDIPNWDEENLDSDSATLAKAATVSGEDTASPDGAQFAKINEGEWICRSVDATGFSSLTLSYYWRGDADAENNEDGVIEYKIGGTSCTSGGSSWTTVASHELDDGNNNVHEDWSSIQSVSLPNNLNGFVRFRNDANSSNEYFRVDGVDIQGEPPVEPAVNPPLGQSCGLDVALVLDSSGSISTTELTQMKDAFESFVSAFLPETPTQFSVTDFDTTASVLQSFTDDTVLINLAINSPTSGGSTNWEDGLLKAQDTLAASRGDVPNLVVFASDGNPNRLGTAGTSATEAEAVQAAVLVANDIKTAGTRIITLGIGNDLDAANLEDISSADAVITSGFDTLAASLATLASELCGGTITVKKLVDADGTLDTSDDQSPASGWSFDVLGSPSDPDSVLTGDDGFTPSVEVEAGTYSVTETTQPGYELLSAVCTINDVEVGTENFSVSASDIVACTFINHQIQKPVITLSGPNPDTIIVNPGPYVDPGYSAFDLEDGDLTSSVEVTGTVDTTSSGSYTLYYNVTDSDLLAADEVTRTVNVNNPPSQCSDGVDNDEDGTIDFAGGPNQEPADTSCDNSEDNDENSPPVITVEPELVTLTLGGSFDPLAGVTVTDAEDEPDPSASVGGDSVDPNTIGDYVVTYDATDSDGAAASQKTRTVQVRAQCADGIDNDGDGQIDSADNGCGIDDPTDNDENTPPIISLTGSDVIELVVGDTYTELGATADDAEDGNGLIVTDINSSAVNTGAVGAYSVFYNFTDSDGSAATQVIRTVNVSPLPQCSDEEDNDEDGLTDSADPACHTDGDPENSESYDPNLNDESNDPIPACADGVDNDEDGLTDLADPGCESSDDDDEFNPPQCSDSSDNDDDGLTDSADPACHTDGNAQNSESYDPSLNDESDDPAQCADGLDNDQDELTDSSDPGCWTDPNDSETYNAADDSESQDPQDDVCANIEGVQTQVPSGMVLEEGDQCVTPELMCQGSDTYTLNADFDQGTLINVTHTPSDQLQLSENINTFNFIWVAVSTKGTVVKINTDTGEIVGEYKTSPTSHGNGDPSRTTVDKDGSVWLSNRSDVYEGAGSVVHIGLVENGQCEDRNSNGLIDTSTAQNDIKAWTDASGARSVATAADECIVHYVKVPTSSGTRHVSVDSDNNVWVAGYYSKNFDLIKGGKWNVPGSGTIIRSESSVGYGGYGGLIDSNGVIWSAANLLRWDTANPLTGSNGGNWTGFDHSSYGLCIDSNGNVFNTEYGPTVYKHGPDGTLLDTFGHGTSYAQGCVVDGNNDLWIAGSLSGSTVDHLKNDGTYVGSVPVGYGPTGVAVDANGKIWSTNYSDGTVSRIDPTAGPIGADAVTPVGAVDFTSVSLGGNPYNYSDMTGSTLSGMAESGTWTVVHDGEVGTFPWESITWNASVPSGANLSVTVATSDDGSTFGAPQTVTSGQDLTALTSRYLKVVVSLERSSEGQSPVLLDLSVNRDCGDEETDVCQNLDGVQTSVPEGFTESGGQCTQTPPPPGGGGGGGGGGASFLIIHSENTGDKTSQTVLVTWFTNHPATSRVVYDTVSHTALGPLPNYGYAFSTIEDPALVTFHSALITGLLPDTTYYFRPISHGSPEVYGIELSSTTISAPLTTPEEPTPTPEPSPTGPETPPAGPTEETPPTGGTGIVAGAETAPAEEGTVAGVEYQELAQASPTPTPTPEPTVAPTPEPEATPAASSNCNFYIWLFFILNLIAVGVAAYVHKDNPVVWQKFLWLIGLALALVPLIWYPQCWLWMWLLATLVIIIVLASLKTSNNQN